MVNVYPVKDEFIREVLGTQRLGLVVSIAGVPTLLIAEGVPGEVKRFLVHQIEAGFRGEGPITVEEVAFLRRRLKKPSI